MSGGLRNCRVLTRTSDSIGLVIDFLFQLDFQRILFHQVDIRSNSFHHFKFNSFIGMLEVQLSE